MLSLFHAEELIDCHLQGREIPTVLKDNWDTATQLCERGVFVSLSEWAVETVANFPDSKAWTLFQEALWQRRMELKYGLPHRSVIEVQGEPITESLKPHFS